MLKKWLVALAAFCGINGAAVAQGIPVFDAANVAQAINQVTAWGQQLSQMQAQLTQQQNLFNSLNGSRGIGKPIQVISTKAGRRGVLEYCMSAAESIMALLLSSWMPM